MSTVITYCMDGYVCVVYTPLERREGEEVIRREGVKDAIGGRLEKKWVLLLLHFVLGCVSDWYFLWLKEGGPGYYLYTELMGMHMNYT